MAIDLYRGFANRVTGETFRCISYDRTSFRFDWLVKPGGYVPFEHVHLHQKESFFVKEGELRILVEGKEHVVGEGQTFSVPKGKRHIAYNNRPSPLHCVVEYSPGLDTYQFFQCCAGLTIDGDITKNGTVNIPKMLYFTRHMKAKCIARPTNIPAPLFQLALNFFFITGKILGWRKHFEKYTRKRKTVRSELIA